MSMATYLAIAFLIAAILTYFLIKSRKARIGQCLTDVEMIADEALDDISHYYSFGHYTTEHERLLVDGKYSDLADKISVIIHSRQLKNSAKRDTIERLHKVLSDSESVKNANNNGFVERQLEMYQDYFDHVLPFPLDGQQRSAIVSLEDNVLVISSAGSGKTMTSVGKVRYLIDKCGVAPDKILLITFTKKAAESLSKRLGEKNLKCLTFHKLALDMISEATGQRPTIAGSDFALRIYHDLMSNDPTFKMAVSDYIVRSKYKMKSQFEYTSHEEYIRDRQKYGVQASYKDMDGKPVFCKSDEESRICDFLSSRGVMFRYEEPYEISTVDKEYRQYVPDFSIYYNGKDGKRHRIYLEHYALNEAGQTPPWFTMEDETNYRDGIIWKRALHKKHNTVLIETRSAQFHDGSIWNALSGELQKYGISFNMAGKDNLSRELAQQEHSIIDMLTGFVFLLKSRAGFLTEIKKESRQLPDDSFTMNDIVIPFVNAYNKGLEDHDMLDFTDAIIKATELCNSDFYPDWDYILVDEFQDISLDRYRFLQSLRRKNPLTKLFCVGDDWQSIYRFAGSDMALFKSFDKYFGYTKECRMETTYRFGEPLIGTTSKFIMRNPGQKEKSIRSFDEQLTTNLSFVPTSGEGGMTDKLCSIIDSIPKDKSVFILGRYTHDSDTLDRSRFSVTESNGNVNVTYGGRTMQYMTVHQSKGLECDYVILLNCNSGAFGFPADISDNPIMKYVLSEPDSYRFGEERRVFYVGITRAKIHTFVMYDADNPSEFVGEFVKLPEKHKVETFPKEELCPKCHCGRRLVKHKGIADNGNPYSVYECSNSRYGCDYRETVFVNLNQRNYYRKTTRKQ